MSDLVPLAELDRDPVRRFTVGRADLSRLVRKLRHRGFGDVAASRTDVAVQVTGRHRLTGNTVLLCLEAVVAGEHLERRWFITLGREGTTEFSDLWVGTRHRWRTLGELAPVGQVAAAAERRARFFR